MRPLRRIESPHDDSALNTLNAMVDILKGFDATQFYELGDNLFNKDAVVSGVLRASDGEVDTSDDRYVTSEFMPVTPGDYIQIKPTAGITVRYDKDRNYIGSIGSQNYPYLVPEGTRYLRTTTNKANVDTKYVYIGQDDREYSHYGAKWSDGIFDDEMFAKIQEGIDQLGDVRTDLTNLIFDIMEGNYVPKYKNLFDPQKITSGVLSTTTGEVNPSDTYVVSDFIQIIPGEYLQIKPDAGITVVYDDQKNRVTHLSSQGYPHLMPDNAKYVRTTMNRLNVEGKYVYLGEEDMEYAPYYGDEDSSEPLKILIIGNSYSVDTFYYLYDICRSVGINVVIGVAHNPGGSLQEHMDNIRNDVSLHSYYKWDAYGQYVRSTNTLTDSAITDEDWDIIFFQQMSTDSLSYSTFQPHLTDLKNHVKDTATNEKVRFGMNAIWSRSTSNAAVGDEETQLQMWQDITENYQQAMYDSNIEILIPSGTAIQNGRANSFLVQAGDELTRDGSHLDEGIGRYLAAMTAFVALFGSQSLNKVDYVPEGTNNYLSSLSKMVAKNAVLHPYKITEL